VLIYVVSFLALAAVPLALGGYGGHLAAEVISHPKHRGNAMLTVWGLAALGVVLSCAQQILTYRADQMHDKERADLPRQVAEYIRNTSPAPQFLVESAASGRPAAPTGLVAVVNGHTGTEAISIGDQIFEFLSTQGDPPQRRLGETEVDFLIRPNAWYKQVMDAYHATLQAQTETIARMLVESHSLPANVLDLARNPVNLIGVRAVAKQLELAGKSSEKSMVRQ